MHIAENGSAPVFGGLGYETEAGIGHQFTLGEMGEDSRLDVSPVATEAEQVGLGEFGAIEIALWSLQHYGIRSLGPVQKANQSTFLTDKLEVIQKTNEPWIVRVVPNVYGINPRYEAKS